MLMSKGAVMLIWAIVTCMVIGVFFFLNSQAGEQTLVNHILNGQDVDSVSINSQQLLEDI